MPPRIIRAVSAIVIIAIAVAIGWTVWRRHSTAPTTRDGRVRAEIVRVAPDVAGVVTEVAVRDNQAVKRGDLLFVLDSERNAQTLDQAEADLAEARAEAAASRAGVSMAEANTRANQSLHTMENDRAERRAKLTEWLSEETIADARAVAATARDNVSKARADEQVARANVARTDAAVLQAQSRVEQARLNVERSYVRAPSDGVITNLDVKEGDYAAAGQQLMALLLDNSLWVYGYFEETKIPAIHVGDPAQINMMAGGVQMRGVVDSVSLGIADTAADTSGNLLAEVTPTFSWVRLAQRIPVRIRIDPASIPKGTTVAAGMTVSIKILPREPGRTAT